MMAGPDPYGYPNYPINDVYFETSDGRIYAPGYDDRSWIDLISEGIGAAQDVARVAVGGYPPQDIYAPIYAPQYPAQQQPQAPAPMPTQQAQGSGGGGVGFSISTPTLMLFVGGALLFMLGSKRGR